MNTKIAGHKVTPGMADIITKIARRIVAGESTPKELDSYLECFGMRSADVLDLIEVDTRVTVPDTEIQVPGRDYVIAARWTDACIESGWRRLTPWERTFVTGLRAIIDGGFPLTERQVSKLEAIYRRRVYRYEHMAG